MPLPVCQGHYFRPSLWFSSSSPSSASRRCKFSAVKFQKTPLEKTPSPLPNTASFMESFAKKMKMSINEKTIGEFDAQDYGNRPVKIDFTLKVDNFSSFSKYSIEKYVSMPFMSGDYCWELVLYPQGNPKEDGKDHISIYLRLSDRKSVPLGQYIIARYKIYLFDYALQKFTTFNGDLGQISRFYAQNREFGFPKLIPLTTFRNKKNGYLVNDTCSFGVEIFVHRYYINTNTLRMKDAPVFSTHTWVIENYSLLKTDCRLSDTMCGFAFLLSPLFSVGDYKCHIQFFPEGNGERDKFTSFFLKFDGQVGIKSVYAKCILRLKAQSSGKYFQREVTGNFIVSHGWPDFMEIDCLTHPGRGFLVNDNVVIEADFTV